MTLTIQLAPDVEARLDKAARDEGLAVEECALRLLAEHLPPAEAQNPTLALLAQWREEDATDDPEEIRKAEEEWEEFKRNMNATRAAAGTRLLYP